MSTNRNRSRNAQRDRMRQVATGHSDDGRQRLGDIDQGQDPGLPGMPEQSAPPTPPAPKSAQAAPAVAPRVRPVRTTVELAPREHASLKRFCADSAEELGLSSIAGAEVLRTLYGLMREDPALADRVRAALAASGGTRRR